MSYKIMNRKTFWLIAVVLLAMLPLSLGYVQAQITGFIPVFVDESGSEDASNIFQDANGNIGIGTTSPAAKLHVDGTLRIDNGAFSQSSVGNFDVDAPFVPGGRLRILENGNVGIGTPSAFSRLEVKAPRTPALTAITGIADGAGAIGISASTNSTATGTTALWAQTRGSGLSSRGVFGVAENGIGVYGITQSLNGIGVVASSNNGEANLKGLQVYGFGRATGSFSSGSGASEIDHPLDPANKYLRHAYVGSPDMKQMYDGVVVLDGNGEAEVQLPEWFESVNEDFRYQLTNIGSFAPVYIAEEISANRFKIAGGMPRQKVSWQVTGIRKDPYAQSSRVRVEEEKPVLEKGFYLHPGAYGLPQTKSVAATAGALSADLWKRGSSRSGEELESVRNSPGDSKHGMDNR